MNDGECTGRDKVWNLAADVVALATKITKEMKYVRQGKLHQMRFSFHWLAA